MRHTVAITRDSLPAGHWWEHDGACWKAVPSDPHPATGKDWRWSPCNLKAFAKEEPEGEMTPHYPIQQANLNRT